MSLTAYEQIFFVTALLAVVGVLVVLLMAPRRTLLATALLVVILFGCYGSGLYYGLHGDLTFEVGLLTILGIFPAQEYAMRRMSKAPK